MTCASHRALLLTDVSLAMRSDEGLIVWMRDIFHQSGLSHLRRTGPQDQIPSCGATLKSRTRPGIRKKHYFDLKSVALINYKLSSEILTLNCVSEVF